MQKYQPCPGPLPRSPCLRQEAFEQNQPLLRTINVLCVVCRVKDHYNLLLFVNVEENMC